MDEQQVKKIAEDILKQDQFSVPKVAYHIHNNIDSPNVPFLNISQAPAGFIVANLTTGTTPVNIFGKGGANFNFTATGAFAIAQDTTAGTITWKNKGNTLATLAKSTTSGAMVGATNLATGTVGTYTRGNSITVESSSTGNVTAFLTFKVT